MSNASEPTFNSGAPAQQGVQPQTGFDRPVDAPVNDESHQVVATYRSYSDAQAAVDYLSDQGFEVSAVQIVGRGLHSVEQVVGRMTKGRAALAGVVSGAFWGLFIGLLFGILVPNILWASAILWSIVLGAVFGAIFGFIGHAMTGGRRDFASVQRLEADEYVLLVANPLAAQAASILRR